MDVLLNVETKALVCQNSNFALKDYFQLLAELDQVQKAASAVHLHQQVDVAGRPCFSSRHRSKHTHVVNAMLFGNLKDVVALGFQHLSGSHGSFPVPLRPGYSLALV